MSHRIHDEVVVDMEIERLGLKYCLEVLQITFDWLDFCREYPVYTAGYQIDWFGDKVCLVRKPNAY